jgi:hypothetical protein
MRMRMSEQSRLCWIGLPAKSELVVIVDGLSSSSRYWPVTDPTFRIGRQSSSVYCPSTVHPVDSHSQARSVCRGASYRGSDLRISRGHSRREPAWRGMGLEPGDAPGGSIGVCPRPSRQLSLFRIRCGRGEENFPIENQPDRRQHRWAIADDGLCTLATNGGLEQRGFRRPEERQ